MPKALTILKIDSLEFVNPIILQNIIELSLEFIRISDFLRIRRNLNKLIFLNINGLTGRNCAEFESFVTAFENHDTWVRMSIPNNIINFSSEENNRTDCFTDRFNRRSDETGDNIYLREEVNKRQTYRISGKDPYWFQKPHH